MNANGLRPSWVEVMKAIDALEDPTAAEIIEQTGYSESTVWKATRGLHKAGLVDKRPSVIDARQTAYGVNGDGRKMIT